MAQAQAGQVAAKLQTAGYTVSDPEVLDMFVNLALEFGITPVNAAEDFDIMNSLKENYSTEVSANHVSSKAFRDFLTKQHLSSTKAPPAAPRTAVKQPFGSSWENMSDKEASLYQPTPKRQAIATPGAKGITASRTPLPHTPLNIRRTPGESQVTPTPAPSTVKFDQRTTKGELVSTLNDSIPEWEGKPAGPIQPLQLSGEPLPVVGQHLYMADTLDNKVQAMEERLLDWAEYLASSVEGAGGARHQSVTQITQEPVWCVGRVVLESNAEEGPAARLSLSTLQLEGSRSASQGARVRLDVTPLTAPGAKGCRLFPGQLLGVRGVNPTGHCLIAQEVVAGLPAPLAPPCPGPACMVVAAGPFSTHEDLVYSPLDHLLQHCASQPPSLLVLLGPFVDVGHASIQSGLLARSYESVFQEEVVQRLMAWQAKHPNTQIVLVPAVSDAHHAPVFPTPAFSLQQVVGVSSDALTSLQNPCVFSTAGGLMLGASSADVLKALSGSELAVGNTGMDRMSSLASQLLGQRSMFPLFPAPVGACLDLSHGAALAMHSTPHVLLLPSDLAPFAKLLPVPAPPASPATAQAPAAEAPGSQPEAAASTSQAPEQVVCINPGRLMRGAVGGTFAILTVAAGEASVASRCRVDIKRV